MSKSSQNHSFCVHVAIDCGMHAAAVLNHLHYWINHNRIEGKAQHEGKTWTYQSRKTMGEYLPYLTDKEIRGALEKLLEKGYIIKGEFNKNKFDHTTWYSLPDSPPCLKERENSNSFYEGDERANQLAPRGKSMGSETANLSYNKDIEKDVVAPSEISKNFSSIDKQFCKSDFQRLALKKDWTEEEIDKTWDIFEKRDKDLVDDPFAYFDGIIEKQRKKSKLKELKEKNQCQNIKSQEISQQKQEIKESNNWDLVSPMDALVAYMEEQKSKIKLCLS